MANDKVFRSDIIRTLNKSNNNLYDLLPVNTVKPLPKNENKYLSCNFVPRTDKYFIPKKKLKPKVKTVRDIRNLFEKDISSTLSIDLEKQQNVLLCKIRGGSSKDEKTKLLAKNMLTSDNPISRTAWQMMININPNNCAHSTQYILWNGKCIQVNGSRGGKSKFIYKYDLEERKASLLRGYKFKKGNSMVKKKLLKDSLNIKFKPGPLSVKKQLDTSYQKYNIGNVELVNLPKPGLDILPEYGKRIETSIANFLHDLRDVNGIISDKWAEFAVSALGVNDNGHPVQLNKDSFVTFDLGYKHDQQRLLMRRNIDKVNNSQIEKQIFCNSYTENEETLKQEVQKMLDEMVSSVEISLTENKMYTGEDCPRDLETEDTYNCFNFQTKDKVKRKGQNELHRLDVTVIRLCDNEEEKEMRACQKPFCTLGCICDSILSSFRLKKHCGRIECMFDCKCDFNKYNFHSYFEDDILPGLVSLEKENNLKLSKEEQKFHQTVILSGEKSILLKSQRRNWKAPNKYADFYSTMHLKTKKDIKRILSVMEIKLNCANIEPWCMIHNLYKCFCKGKFTENLCSTVSNEESKSIDSESINSDTKLSSPKNHEEVLKNLENCKKNEPSNRTSLRLRPRINHAINYENQSKKSPTDNLDDPMNICYKQCARMKPFNKRKYSDIFYLNANKKIMELEKNDHGLHKRLMEILNIDESSDKKKSKNDSANCPTIDLSSSPGPGQISPRDEAVDKSEDKTLTKLSSDLTSHNSASRDVITTQFTLPSEQHLNIKLKAWLEPSLRIYKQRFGNGFFKKSLDPPKVGKISLYPWDFIVSRYHDKKNIFLVTNQKPFRIYMAVDNKNAMFHNCVDIRTIDDMDRYPISVRNIITKEVNRLSDQLCILRGLSFCWELVGSIKKVCDRKNLESTSVEAISPQNLNQCPKSPITAGSNLSFSPENITEHSKWFIMSIESDFTEIQFYNRGFFVKYDSIIKAIDVARASDKTVRLSSQKYNGSSNDPQFGIYAIPDANESCVFIGPYEKNEPLGIEIVKNTSHIQNRKTKGVWITTNKVDNVRVIENPLSFITHVDLENGQILDDSSTNETISHSVSSTHAKSVVTTAENKIVKLVKPIKITKTNNFYHLTPSGILKPISISPEKQISKTPIILRKSLSLDGGGSTSPLLSKALVPQLNESNKYIEEKQKSPPRRPIAEIAPQVKVTEECEESNKKQQKTSGRKFEGGMFILKPEEINSRSLINKICYTPSPIENNVYTNNDEIDMDIENFLANSVECTAPTADVYVISDDEDYCNNESNKECWKEVWIICKTVKEIGWIPGRQDTNGRLSFEFPGFKYTEFYAEQEAFAKITQVLARKVYIPEHVNLCWSVVHTAQEICTLKKLKQEDLNLNYVLTKHGLIHKTSLAEFTKLKIKTYSRNVKEEQMELDDKKSTSTLTDLVQKREELSETISNMSNDRRQEISDRLRSIISSANYS